jgi:3-phenylpropionate/trans-cinnamate dioxygenase ferredoxin subunit
MNDWVDVCAVEDVPEPGALRVMLGAEPVAVVRSEGQLYAIRDVCSHADVALSEGDVEGCFIECWLHGSRFDLRTGVPASLPALSAVPVYAVRIDGNGPQARIHVLLNAGGQSA